MISCICRGQEVTEWRTTVYRYEEDRNLSSTDKRSFYIWIYMKIKLEQPAGFFLCSDFFFFFFSVCRTCQNEENIYNTAHCYIIVQPSTTSKISTLIGDLLTLNALERETQKKKNLFRCTVRAKTTFFFFPERCWLRFFFFFLSTVQTSCAHNPTYLLCILFLVGPFFFFFLPPNATHTITDIATSVSRFRAIFRRLRTNIIRKKKKKRNY